LEPEQEQWKREARAALDEHFTQVRFLRATDLARSGRYLEAESLLTRNGQPCQTPRELDLLARVAAHQGRFEDARRLWQTALQREPQSVTYSDCLARVAEFQHPTALLDKTLTLLLWAAIAFGVAALLFAFLPAK
jgi:Tetratricopeptide repeat